VNELPRLTLSWSAPEGPRTRELGAGGALVGRAEDCDVVLADRAVSRRHARIVRHGDDWWLEDLGSRAGTFLNGRPIERSARLAADDRIGIGEVVITVRPRRRPPRPYLRAVAAGTSIFRRADELLGARSLGAEPRHARLLPRGSSCNDVHQASAALARASCSSDLDWPSRRSNRRRA
jgi:predicted component of type VI protein secretion system